ncbi:hypothetical protein BCR43DRAFT_524329 [Syncephalastrum racemosum]|uniref:Uncharacterized protein n=1 Tax=Syncephalastrum racemosum TaxID=13706 RepID=A0A1X2HBM4_SYNRA|nr:hypothetical protein BCR43DRAFT_524329 [Syncephalastrum racemosum]
MDKGSTTTTTTTQASQPFPFNKHSDGPSDARQRPHRCNAHLEDFLEGLSTWPMDVAGPFKVFLQCLRSKPGQEPPRYIYDPTGK